jgi:ubiquinone biosynthesis protein UbiJ
MITGIAVLGTLAGSLASFLRFGNGNTANGSSAGEPGTTTAMPNDAPLAALATEVTALRHQVEALTERLAEPPRDLARKEPTPGGDAAG